jgi:hypothetical protein
VAGGLAERRVDDGVLDDYLARHLAIPQAGSQRV